MSKKWESAHTQKALLMRTKGASFNTIAKELGFSKVTVIHNLKKPDPNYSQSNAVMSDAEIEQLRRMVDAGCGSRAICRALRRRIATVQKYAKEYRALKGIVLPKRFEWTEEKKELAITLLDQGYKHQKIAEEIGCARNSVSAFFSNKQRQEPKRTKPVYEFAPIVPPRTIMNSTMREPLPKGGWTPTRPGALDYAKIPRRGF